MNWFSNKPQIKWTCEQLLLGREISQIDELVETRGWRLSAIIHTLRHQYYWPIVTKKKNKVAYYSLEENTDLEKLKKPPSFFKQKKGDATPLSN
jgi:hypothetical protein